MVVTMYDAVADFISMLTTGWTAGTVPLIREAWNVKAVGLGSDDRDEIIITPTDEKIDYFALFGTSHLYTVSMVVDIRVFVSYTRHKDVVNEVSRIIKANLRRSSTGFIDVRETFSKSYNMDYRNMFRHTIDIIYRKHINFP